MKFRARILFIAFILLLFTLAAAAAPETHAQGHSIRGKVRSSAGGNIARATVSLELNGAMVDQTVTNNEGDFSFTGLGGTSYVVVVSAPDYNSGSERVEFVRTAAADQPGELRMVEVTLNARGGVRPPRAGLNFVQNVPKAARDAFESAMKLSRENRVPEAVAAYENAIKIFPDYFDARFVLANQFIQQNKLAEAIAQLEETRRINGRDDRVYHLFGIVMMRQGKYAVAARIFSEAARLSPSDQQYLILEGTALVDQAATIDPKRSQAAADERNFALTKAEESLLKAHGLGGKKLAEVHRQLARLYEKRGERARAADELEQYLRKSPDLKNAAAIREAVKQLRTNAANP